MRQATIAFCTLFLCLPARGQVADSVIVVDTDPVVVTAERVASRLSHSTAAVSVLSPREIARLPNRTVSDVLGMMPGLSFLDFDGSGFAPQSVTRGFYGGGEAEYVIVLVNGKPINNLENGLINWDRLTSSASTSVEVLRGGASSLYGDAAIGAVVNIRTTPVEGVSRRLRGRIGSLGLVNGLASIQTARSSLTADVRSSDGYRDHNKRTSGTIRGSHRIVNRQNSSITISGGLNIREFETPGPLRDADADENREQNLLFFRFDEGDERTYRTAVDAELQTGIGLLTGSVAGEVRDHNNVRTLPLSADFADTQERQVDASVVKFNALLSEVSVPVPLENTLVVGVDASVGSLDSRYYHVATGGISDTYLTSTGARGDLLSDGTVSRTSVAGYAHLELNPSSRTNISLGGRMDWIEDSFSEKEGLSEAVPSASHGEFSPKAGINYRYASSATQIGNLYASVSRSFKAPSLDQLYDLRAFPVPFPPFAIQIANSELKPQYGTNYEVGFYHRAISPNGLTMMLSGSLYQIDMRDEIDFSFDTFSNVNIGKSRHQGIETGLRIEKDGLGSAFLNWTLQDVTSRIGENEGKAVKAIPKYSFSAGLVADLNPVTGSLVLRGNRQMYLDDANTTRIPNYTVVDARLSYTQNVYTLVFDVFNVFDTTYHSTAYPDPAGSEVQFLFPAATRSISVGIEIEL